MLAFLVIWRYRILAVQGTTKSNRRRTFACIHSAAILALGLLVSVSLTGTETEVKPSAASLGQAKRRFETTCATCHSANGSPTKTGRSLGAPDLRSSKVQKSLPAKLRSQIINGSSNMPPFGALLTPFEIDALVSYVKTLGNTAKPSTPDSFRKANQ